MESILSRLYEGGLSPGENGVRDNPAYDALCRQSLQEMEAFTGKLSRELKEEFDALLAHYLELTFTEKSQAFSDGFCMGAGIMWEVFRSLERAGGSSPAGE